MDIKLDNRKKSIIMGAFFGIAVTAMFVLIFAGVMLLFKIDRAYASVFATISVSAGAFVSAYYCARKIGSKGYLLGILTGLIYFFVVTVISLIITKGEISSNTAFHFVIITLSATVGGIFGVNRKKTKLL